MRTAAGVLLLVLFAACKQTNAPVIPPEEDVLLWETVNGPLGGVVADLEVNANGVFFAAAQYGGVHRSVDGGVSWASLGMSHITSVAINNAGILVGGGYLGAYYSSDEGETWTGGSPQPAYVSDLAVDPQGNFLAATPSGILRSTDGGMTWAAGGLSTSYVFKVAAGENGVLLAATMGPHVFRSTDGGSNWTQTGLDVSVTSLMITSLGHFLAGTSAGIFVSTDQGNTWTWKHTAVSDLSVMDIVENAGATILAATSSGLYQSADNGMTWGLKGLPNISASAVAVGQAEAVVVGTEAGVFRWTGSSWDQSGLYEVFVYDIAASAGGLFVGTEAGVFRSTDEGSTWRDAGIGSSWFLVVASSPSGILFAGSYAGMYRSSNSGLTWSKVSDNYASCFTFGSGVVYSGGWGVQRSTDGGVHWSAGTFQGSVNSLAVHPDGTLFAAAAEITRSPDGGVTWYPVNSPTGLSSPYVQALVVDAQGRLFAGDVKGIYMSTDKGLTWLSSGLDELSVQKLVEGANQILACTSQGLYRLTSEGLKGEHWQRTGLSVSCRSATSTPHGRLYAVAFPGILRSKQ